MKHQTDNKGIIIFDGYCNLCSGLVKFIIKRDKKDYFRFVPMQSDSAIQLYEQFKIPVTLAEYVILVIDNTVFSKSDAVLMITSKLGGFCSVFSILKVIPKQFRDFIYTLIANKRYKWFGKKTSCLVPTEKINNKFIV